MPYTGKIKRPCLTLAKLKGCALHWPNNLFGVFRWTICDISLYSGTLACDLPILLPFWRMNLYLRKCDGWSIIVSLTGLSYIKPLFKYLSPTLTKPKKILVNYHFLDDYGHRLIMRRRHMGI